MSPHSYRILLIENESSLVHNIWRMAQGGHDPSFHVVSVETLRSAASKLASEKFDALLLDTRVCDCERLAGMAEIRSHGGSPPIVVLVSQKEEELGKRSLHSGAAEYLLKETLNRELLRKALRYAINLRRAEVVARQCEQRFHDLLENAKDTLFTLCLDGTITPLNTSDEEVLGLPLSEPLQFKIKSLVAHEDQGDRREALQSILLEEPLPPVVVVVSNSGGQVRVENFIFTQPDAATRLIGVRIDDISIDAPSSDVLASPGKLRGEEIGETGLPAQVLAAQELASELIDRAIQTLAPLEIKREALNKFIWEQISKRRQGRG